VHFCCGRSENISKCLVKTISSYFIKINLNHESKYGIKKTIDESFKIFRRLFQFPDGSLECFRFVVNFLYANEFKFDEKTAKMFLENQPQLTKKREGLMHENCRNLYFYKVKVKDDEK
jgi:hypothetical protein